ncbi:MAG TPA: hypothetical protein VI588_03935 [Candidatus Gracilibacteria bacterium]|nr:hypothetical protein [Candidatus Gracilibacteria bacterium]
MKPGPVSARKTLRFASQGSVEVGGKVEISDAPPASSNPPSTSAPSESGDVERMSFITERAVAEILSIEPPEPLFRDLHEPLSEDLPPYDEEDEIVASRPAILDIPAFKPAPKIEKRRRSVSNKVRVAIAIGGGIALGLLGTGLYRAYGMEKPARLNTAFPIPEDGEI